jgi:DNA-binding NarL/FixJ family response regulator
VEGQVVDGAALMDAASRLRPDVVVLHLHLPGMNGSAACHQIRESALNATVVVVSAATDPEIQDYALPAGASAFVSRYAIADDLETAVKQAFEKTLA